MHIAVDMDDVVVEFFSSVIECVEREYGPLGFGIEEITDWDDNPMKLSRIFAAGGTWWDWLRSRDWLWAQFPAVPGAIGGLQMLRDAGHRVELLTSKPLWAEWVVWDWAGKWRPPVDSITIADPTKPKFESTSASLLVDDALHNIHPWLKRGPGVAILYDRPWNRKERGVPRANNWADVVRMIGEIA